MSSPRGMVAIDLDPITVAKAFHESGMFPDLKSQAQAVVKIVAGQELGFGPMAAMQSINMIQGRPTLSANGLAALVKKHPAYDYRIKEQTDVACSIEFFQLGESVGVSSFTMDDATKAGLLASSSWKKYPAAMLFARALSQGVRWHCPDVTAGAPAYVPEELGAEVDVEGEVLAHVVAEAPQEIPADVPDSMIAEDVPDSISAEDVPDSISAEYAGEIQSAIRTAGLKIREVDEVLQAAALEPLRARSKGGVIERVAAFTRAEAVAFVSELSKEGEGGS